MGRFIHWCIRYCQSAGIYICNDCDGIESGYAAHCGYNFGAQQYARVSRVLKLTIIFATVVTTSGFLMGMLVPELVVSIFTSDEELIAISARGLRVVVMFSYHRFPDGDIQLFPEYRNGK